MQFIVATRNAGKLPEIRAILAPLGHTAVSLSEAGLADLPEPEETGATFVENAVIKAGAVWVHRPGSAVIADDSGLCVDALDGRPGVYSARYAPNNERCGKLLAELAGHPDRPRTARFVCCVCAMLPDGRVLNAEGRCEGTIARQARGEGGFGFDPVFIPAGYDETFGELSPAIKDRISHRAAALARLAILLKEGSK